MEKIKYDIQLCKGYKRMPREILRSNRISSRQKNVVAYIYSYSNTRKPNSTCTRTYKEFAKDLNVSCATISRAFKRIKTEFSGLIKQTGRAEYAIEREKLGSNSYLIIENYFSEHEFTFEDGTTRHLSAFTAHAAALIYDRFFKDAKERGWEHDKRQRVAISAYMSVRSLSKATGVSEKSAAKAISELLSCGIIFLSGRRQQLNGYFCRNFKPELKVLDAIHETRKLKKYKLAEAQALADDAEKQRLADRDEKIRAARRSDERYKPLLEQYDKFLTLCLKGMLTDEQYKKWQEVEAKINKLDDEHARDG